MNLELIGGMSPASIIIRSHLLPIIKQLVPLKAAASKKNLVPLIFYLDFLREHE
jgi:hypothetical protein